MKWIKEKIKTIFAVGTFIVNGILIFLVIISFFIKLDTTQDKKEELLTPGIFDYISLAKVDYDNNIEMVKVAYDYSLDKYKVQEDLNVLSGVKNGIFVVVGFFRDLLVGFGLDYLAGFYDKGLIGKVIWLFLGVVISGFLNLIGAFLGMFGIAFGLLTQVAPIQYYISYIISFILMMMLVFGIAFVE